MTVIETPLPGVLIIEPDVHQDGRGHFVEQFHAERYAKLGIGPFVQDNWSHSVQRTLRGLHFQNPRPQGKLVMVTRGAVFDVAVDVRPSSPTFAKWTAVHLDDINCQQLWVPPGFAHGFVAMTEEVDFLYKCTDVYVPEAEGQIVWDDPDIGIAWPITYPLLSKKDAAAPRLRDVKRLP